MRKHDHSVELMIERNNQLREELTTENKTYYEQLLLYIRTAGLFYDDHEIESLLLQILQDILSAQNDGQSAVEFFGKSPQLAADEMINNLGKASWKETLKLVGLVFGISFFFTIMDALSAPGKGINLLVLIQNGLLSFLLVGMVFFVIHKSIYTKIKTGKVVSYLLLWFFFVFVIGSFILIQLFTPSLLTVHLSNLSGILVISILLIGMTVWVLSRNKQDRQGWRPFIPFIYIMGLIGIGARLPLTEDWMASSRGKIAIAILTGFGLLLFFGLTYVNLRKKKKK